MCDGRKNCACIVNLVVARELSLYFAPIRSSIVEFAVHILGSHYPALLFRPIEGGFCLIGERLEYAACFRCGLSHDYGNAGFDDTGFLRGYFFEGVP